MIESIQIKDVATYGSVSEQLTALSSFNFLYGSNGSGKTTISRVIADESVFPSCAVTWRGGTKLQTMVYNRDFVTANFNQSTELKGIFTLGQQEIDTLKKIAEAKAELDALTSEIKNLRTTLQGEDGTSGKKGELTTLEEEFKNKCWAQKQKHDEKLQGAFEGYRGSSEKFKIKLLQEHSSNTALLQTLDFLEKKAETVFGEAPAIERMILKVEAADVIAHGTNSILKKRVLGKEDVNIAAMIKKLSNSDWVKQGRTYYEINDKNCPFCQQSTSEAFAQSLDEYFDETFLADVSAIDKLISNYSIDASRLQQQVAAVIAQSSKFLEVDKLKIEKELLDSILTINTQKLDAKRKEPSQVSELEPIGNVLLNINALIDAANTQTSQHNTMVSNLAKEQRNLTSEVWKYLLEVELKADLLSFDTKKNALSKAISGISTSLGTKEEDKHKKSAEIRTLEKDTTSIQPTIDGINALLKSFGFRGFSLAKAQNGICYKLVRADGTDAQETLSEGEKTFVTFLYFYHLLKGSDSESGVTTDRVVVFDDPVSSLDSDILFLVGGLIKALFEEIRTGTGHIKQIFVLTHNVYFHKEVTFNTRRQDVAMNEETFWVVRKSDDASKLEKHTSNPIRTSYELLWTEIRRTDRSKLTIQNTMRRIIENYFKILGKYGDDDLIKHFDNHQEQEICRSLICWINDGSHSIPDDLFVEQNDSTVEKYFEVFRKIFVQMGHPEHYKMMMGEA